MPDILHKVGIQPSVVETGEGAPDPHDVRIDSWT